MKNFILSTLVFFLIPITLHAQSASGNPVDEKFTELIESSNSFKEYKVVNFNKLTDLQKETFRYIEELKTEIEASHNSVESLEERLAQQKAELAEVNSQLKQVEAEKDAIEFLGMPFTKGTYKTVMWSIVGVLLLALLFFIYRYKKGHSTTREARKRMEETEKELEAFRAKALEKEQRLGRLLQDERNKHSNKAI